MQSLVNDILREYFNKFCVVYLDNILIFSDNNKEYKGYITTILKVLKKIRLWIKLEKYIFYVDEVEYFKFIIINWELRINSAKI